MDIWAVLGIETTRDPAEIRRAYAAQLKQTPPQTDPEGFARLREAYEAALAHARAGSPTVSAHILDPLIVTRPVVLSAAPAVEAMPPETVPDQGVLAIGQALATGNVTLAADLMVAGRAVGTLALADDMRLTDQLCGLLTHERSLAPLDIVAAATAMGWFGPGASSFPALRGLQARIEAERWLESLRRLARSRLRFMGLNPTAAATLMLGRGRVWGSWILPPIPPLRQVYSSYLLHERWIGSAFDGDRIETVRRLVTGGYTRRAPGLFAILIFGSLVGSIAWVEVTGGYEFLEGRVLPVAIAFIATVSLAKMGKRLSLAQMLLFTGQVFQILVRPALWLIALVAIPFFIVAVLNLLGLITQ